MIDCGPVVAVYRRQGIVERHQQIGFDVADLGGVLVDTVKDIFQMLGGELQEAALDHLPGKVISGNADIGALGEDCFQDQFHGLVHTATNGLADTGPLVLFNFVFLETTSYFDRFFRQISMWKRN